MNCHDQWDIFDELFDKMFDFYAQEVEYIYGLLRDEKLDLNELVKKHISYKLVENYNDSILFSHHGREEKIMDFRELISLPIYPTFNEYTKNVLCKKLGN